MKDVRKALKYLFLAVAATALFACGILCMCFANSQTPLSVAAGAADSGADVSPQALTNAWTTEPALDDYRYGTFTTVTGAAEQGEVCFSVYRVVDGVPESDPVNAVLTDFTLTEGKVSEAVKDAMNGLNVGDYILKASAQAEGYDPLSKEVGFSVTQYQNNGFVSGTTPQIVSWTWGDEPEQIHREPLARAGNLKFTLQGDGIAGVEEYDTWIEFNDRIGGRTDKGLLGIAGGYRNYKATVSVAETDNYTEFYMELPFCVKKKITFGEKPFYINSITYGTKSLAHGDGLDYYIPEFVESPIDKVSFSVRNTDDNIVLQQEVILRDGHAADRPSLNSKKALAAKLLTLDAGSYTVWVEVFEGETYGSCSYHVGLEVAPAVLTNMWAKEPAFIDKGNGAAWEFEKEKLEVSAELKVFTTSFKNFDLNGEMLKTYYTRIEGENGTQVKGEEIARDVGGSTANMPRDVGKYFVEFNILKNNNYSLDENEIRLVPFEITMANDPTFTTEPYAVGWTWNSFDKNVNLFGAVATRGGVVDFTVKKERNGAAIEGLERFRVDAQNVIVDENGLSEKLNGLDSGNYVLEVHVASSGNYLPFTGYATFQIAKMPNSWTKSPNIARWAQYYFNAEENTPQAAALYGDVVMQVRGKNNGELYYKFENGKESVARLAEAPAGWYTFSATVADTGNYSGLNYDIEFQVFSESADMPNNYWVVVPTIESWIGGTTPSEPVYQSLRGTVVISYCKAEWKDGKYVAVGDATQEQPDLPGKYFMLARVKHEILPQDELLKHDVLFEIFERINEWTVTPSIQSYTLGEGPSTPFAEVRYTDDCVIDVRYRLKSGGAITSELPLTPGEYVMVVTATAKYCAPLTAEVEFTVSLTQNSWLNAPTIKNWSEDNPASLPIGAAMVGSEYIEYTYARADDPKQTFKEKPTSEGSYIMYAVLEMDGYETLTAQWDFTISSAYDRTLLTIDIVLGILCSICSVVAIVFAIRRSRQNA